MHSFKYIFIQQELLKQENTIKENIFKSYLPKTNCLCKESWKKF